MQIAQKKHASFVIVVFNSAEVRSDTNVLMDRYSSHSKPFKGTKTFHHIKILSNKIHGNLVSPGYHCHSSSAQMKTKINRDTLSLSAVNFMVNF